MIKSENLKLLKELGKTQYGVALLDFLHEKQQASYKKLATSKDLVEIQAHQQVLGLLEELFSFMKDKPLSKKSKNVYE